MLAYARTLALLASRPHPLVLTNRFPSTILTLVSDSSMAAYAAPPTVFTSRSLFVMFADPCTLAFLASRLSSLVLTYTSSITLLTPRLDPAMHTKAGTSAFLTTRFLPVMHANA